MPLPGDALEVLAGGGAQPLRPLPEGGAAKCHTLTFVLFRFTNEVLSSPHYLVVHTTAQGPGGAGGRSKVTGQVRRAPEPRTPASRWEPRCLPCEGAWGPPGQCWGAGGVVCSPQRGVSFSRRLHPTLPSAVVRQGPASPGLALLTPGHPVCRVSAPLTPDSHRCRLPPFVPRGLRLGVAGPFRSCPELLVTSYLLPWDWVCCWAGHREVTPPESGCACLEPPQELPGFSPSPPSAHFRGHLAPPALLG